MVYDLVVIGGGYWGTAIAYESFRQNFGYTLLLDDADPMGGSRNASGIVDPKIYFGDERKRVMLPDDWTKDDILLSLIWLSQYGGAYPIKGSFLNMMAGARMIEPRPESTQCLHISGQAFFRIHPRLRETVTSIEPCRMHGRGAKGWRVFTHEKGIYETKNVVIAAGYRTDDVLKLAGLPPLGVGKLFGRGLIFTGKPQYSTPLTIMTRPYTKYTIRPWETDGQFRLGDTAEINPNANRALELTGLGCILATDFKRIAEPQGYRPVLPKFTVKKIAPDLVVATGGHRVALGLSGHVAKVALELLK